MPKLNRLQPVELRKIWSNEAADFTPWLAKEENLTLLGETLGMELELEAQEIDVGDFRADILCTDTVDGSRVLIENQLEPTDHNHLGQILTYAAGLDVRTVIWIAKEFQKEHRAALDRLNEITNENFQYFGIEIKVWQIGDSARAPQFEIVSKPNDWNRTVSQNTQRAVNSGLSGRQRQNVEFWTGLRAFMSQKGSQLRCSSPSQENWLTCGLGRTGFRMYPELRRRKKEIGISIEIYAKDATAYFHLLKEQQAEIEKESGESLGWEERRGKQSCRISLRKENTDPGDETDWPNQYEWLASKLELFDKVFRPRIKVLNADDWKEAAEVVETSWELREDEDMIYGDEDEI